MSAEEDARRRQEEWLAAGAPDYNNPTTDSSGNVTGYHSVYETPPELRSSGIQDLRYEGTDWSRKTFAQALADYYKSGSQSGAGTGGGGSMPDTRGAAGAAGSSYVNYNNNNQSNLPAWTRFYDPAERSTYLAGWQRALIDRGQNPFSTNPYMRWLTSRELVEPLVSTWYAQQALTNPDWRKTVSSPTFVQEAMRNFMANPSLLVGGAPLAQQMWEAIKRYLQIGGATAPSAEELSTPYGTLLETLTHPENQNEAASFLAAVLGAGMSPGMQNAIYNRIQRELGLWSLQDQPPEDSFVTAYLRRMFGG